MSDPYPPTELLGLLATGELAAWRRYLLGAACLESFDASPGGVRPPNEVGAEMAAAGKLHTRLAYHFAAPGSEPLIAPAWAPLPDADDWLPFRTWGFPDDEPFILQRKSSIVPLLANTRQDPSEPQEVELHVTLGPKAEREMADGARYELDGPTLRIEGPERGYIIVANGWRRERLRVGTVELDLHSAIVTEQMLVQGWPEFPEAQRPPIAHRGAISPLVPSANDEVHLEITADGFDEVTVHYATSEGDTGTVSTDGRGATLPAISEGVTVRYRIEGVKDRAVTVCEDSGPVFHYPDVELLFSQPAFERFSYSVGPHPAPDWARDSVMYHLLVDRFASHTGELLPRDEVPWLGHAGGTIRGVIEHLDHISSLGIGTLWLSPIFKGQMHVSYDVEEYFDVDPRYGTSEDARQLCREVHARGMHIVLDYEPSYLGSRSPIHLSARGSADSAYRDWFHWYRWPDRAYGWFGSRMLVALDHAHPAVRAHLLDAARFWLDVGFDGFRLDSAHGAPLDFWTEFGSAVRAHRPDALMLGEVMASMQDCRRYAGRINGVMDFEICNALRSGIAQGDKPMSELDAIASQRLQEPDLLAMTIIENHDMDRFKFLAPDRAQERLKAATCALMALPGVPILYYGTEVGIEQLAPGDIELTVRPPMVWGSEQDGDLLAFTTEAVSWRNDHPGLQRGSYGSLSTEPAYVFERVAGDDRVWFGVNPTDGEIELSLGDEYRGAVKSFGTGRVTSDGATNVVKLGPWEALMVSRA